MRRLNITNEQWKKMTENPKLPPNVTFTSRRLKMPNPNAQQLLNRMWKSTLAPESGSWCSWILL